MIRVYLSPEGIEKFAVNRSRGLCIRCNGNDHYLSINYFDLHSLLLDTVDAELLPFITKVTVREIINPCHYSQLGQYVSADQSVQAELRLHGNEAILEIVGTTFDGVKKIYDQIVTRQCGPDFRYALPDTQPQAAPRFVERLAHFIRNTDGSTVSKELKNLDEDLVNWSTSHPGCKVVKRELIRDFTATGAAEFTLIIMYQEPVTSKS